MIMRKINAGISLITTILLLNHAMSIAAWMLSKGAIPKVRSYIIWVMVGLAVVHALICIGFMISGHKGSKGNKGNVYPKMNIPTIIQRISGVLMIIFIWLHIAGTIGLMQPPQVVHAIVPPLFFFIVLAHIAVSASKAFITLGIGDAKFVKRIDIVIKGICAITLIADIIGFYLFVC